MFEYVEIRKDVLPRKGEAVITIAGGKFRGKKIEVPPGQKVRPTLSKNRESTFNVLQNLVDFEEMTALDLYAGSGAMGLEALSRGVLQAIFVENSWNVFQVLKKNISIFPLEAEQALLIRSPVRRWLPHFSTAVHPCLIFIDPPYHSEEYEKILAMIEGLAAIPSQSLLVVESPRLFQYSFPSRLEPIQSKQYGQSKLDFLLKC